jgi:hypothetical protein
MIASPVRAAAAPATVAVNSRRQYHEKDESPVAYARSSVGVVVRLHVSDTLAIARRRTPS